MSEATEVAAGKEWAEKKSKEIASEVSKQVEIIGWVDEKFRGFEIGDFHDYYTIMVRINGEKKKTRFIDEDLTDLGTLEIRRKVETQLRELFEPVKRTIGF